MYVQPLDIGVICPFEQIIHRKTILRGLLVIFDSLEKIYSPVEAQVERILLFSEWQNFVPPDAPYSSLLCGEF